MLKWEHWGAYLAAFTKGLGFVGGPEKPLSHDYIAAHLRVLLKKEGCPVCAEVERNAESYFFWFLNESYGEPEVLEEVARSLGFCSHHSGLLAGSIERSYQISFVYSTLAHRARAWLAQETVDQSKERATPLTALEPCPACANLDRVAARNGFFIARLLSDPIEAQSYGQPGLLCFPHFQRLAQVPGLLERLGEIQTQTYLSARGLLAGSVGSSSTGISGSKLARVLELTVGRRPGLDAVLPAGFREGNWSPVEELAQDLAAADSCPICLQVGRALWEWIGWLEHELERGADLSDVLPTCPRHVWTCAERGSAQLAWASTRNALERQLQQLQEGLKAISENRDQEKKPGLQRWAAKLKRLYFRDAEASEIVARAIRCPVCERLATARDRSLVLLFALLEHRSHRHAFENGYGLCMKHFSRALALAPGNRVRSVLIAVQSARLALLQWELDETLRKTAWADRPEKRGIEQTAWRRALQRFAGLC